MLVEAPLENLADVVEAAPLLYERPIDFVDLTWPQCERRAMRLRSRAGREVLVLLRLGNRLHHGDVLLKTPEAVVVVNVTPCELLVASPSDLMQLATLAFELGNLHAPVEIVQDARQIITVCDGPAQGLFDRLAVPYELETRRFEPTLRGATVNVVAAADFAFTRKQIST